MQERPRDRSRARVAVAAFGGCGARTELDVPPVAGAAAPPHANEPTDVAPEAAACGPSTCSGCCYAAAMATLGETVVSFGGGFIGSNGSGVLDDTWLWDGTSWARAAVPGPPGREYAVMAPVQ